MPSAATETENPPEVLVVTAERREEDPQRIPLSLAVFSGEALDVSGVESTLDLPLVTPGLLYRTNTVLGQPYLRGVGSDLISAGADASVATLVDGVYQSRAVASIWDLYDVDRVEVLKGPQGTLFGRNATGGVIHIVSNPPEAGLFAAADVSYGNFDAVRVRGVVNAPIVEERVFARVSGLFSDRDGFTENVFLNDRVDDVDVWSLRGQIRALAGEEISLHLSGDYARDRSTRGLGVKVGAPFSGSPAVLSGGTVPENPRNVFFDVGPSADVEAWGVSGRATWEGAAVSLDSLSAYRETHFSQELDLDATEVDFISNFPREDSQTFTQEFQLTSGPAGPLEWVAGVFYLHEDASQTLDVAIVPADIRDRPSADVKADAVAIFGHASFDFWERWSVSAGLRYSYERRSLDFVETINGGVVARFDRAEDWDAWTPKFAIEYTPRDDWMLYATVTRGFKSGGFNTTVAQETPFEPEFLWAYEAGLKASLPGGRGHVNAALFYYDYDDIQLQVVSDALIPFPLVENAGKATIWGAEVQAVIRPFEGFSVDFAAAYLNTRFDDLTTINLNDRLADTDLSGNRLPAAPEFSVSVGAQHRCRLSRFGTLTPRLEYRYQSETFFDIYQDDFVRQKGYGLWNARLTFDSADDSWYVAGFGRNLGDELYARNIIRADGAVGNLHMWGGPRTYGFQVGLRY